jgi:hypothetical protein
MKSLEITRQDVENNIVALKKLSKKTLLSMLNSSMENVHILQTRRLIVGSSILEDVPENSRNNLKKDFLNHATLSHISKKNKTENPEIIDKIISDYNHLIQNVA